MRFSCTTPEIFSIANQIFAFRFTPFSFLATSKPVASSAASFRLYGIFTTNAPDGSYGNVELALRYGNSPQAPIVTTLFPLGRSVVIDHIIPDRQQGATAVPNEIVVGFNCKPLGGNKPEIYAYDFRLLMMPT